MPPGAMARVDIGKNRRLLFVHFAQTTGRAEATTAVSRGLTDAVPPNTIQKATCYQGAYVQLNKLFRHSGGM